MLDHMGFAVRDYDRSKAFYEQALFPLGLSLIKEPMGAAAGFGKNRPRLVLDRSAGSPRAGQAPHRLHRRQPRGR